MSDQEFIHQLKTDIQALKIKDEYRSKELDALMSKLDESTEKLHRLSENIGRLLATQDVSKTTNNEFREEMKILHSRIGDLQDKMNMMIDKTEARIDSDIVVLYDKVNTLEKWRWIIIGVTTVIAWALTHLLPKILDN